jgi:hypothetical protein
MFKAFRKMQRWLNSRVLGAKKPWLHAGSSTEQIFTYIHANNLWGDAESASGVGSNLAQTQVLRQRLPALLKELQVRHLLDIPCGDYYWLSKVDLGLASYLGADIVESLIQSNQARYGRGSVSFVSMDLLTGPLPRVDAILCRDCLVHFSQAHVWQALRRIKESGSTYLLTTTYPTRANDKDIATGEWRALNLEAAPFCLPRPLCAIVEGCTERRGRFPDKTLALWKIADLAA